MLSVDPFNLICTVVNLLILFVALRIFLFKPVQKIIAERQAQADAQLKDAADKQKEAQSLKEKYSSSLAQAEEEKKQLLNTARKEADEQYQKIVDEAKAQAKQIEERATVDAENRKNRILKNTEKEIADMVVAAAEKMVGSQSGVKIDRSLYDEFLGKAGEEQ